MNKNILTAGILGLMILLPMAGKAQGTSSPYTMFGIGEIDMGNYGENSGMGGLGIGFRQENTLNSANPASLSLISSKTFIFDGSVYGRFSRFTGQGKTEWVGNGNIQRISVGFRAAKPWTMSFGLVPVSNVGYEINKRSNIEGSTQQISTVFSGDGGLNKVSWSNAFNLSRHISVGVNSSVVFGTITRVESDDYWRIENASRGQKICFDFGLQYSGLVGRSTVLTIGAVGGNKSEMKMHNTQVAYNLSTRTMLTDWVKPTTTQVLPEFYGGGFSLNWRNRLVWGIDYRLQKWSEMPSSVATLRYKDMQKVSAGISYIPAGATARRYWQAVKYQAGVMVNDSYMSIGGDEPLNYAATLGAVLPMRNANSIHVAFEYGKIGALAGNRNVIREDYFKITFGFSFKEAWFLKIKYD